MLSSSSVHFAPKERLPEQMHRTGQATRAESVQTDGENDEYTSGDDRANQLSDTNRLWQGKFSTNPKKI